MAAYGSGLEPIFYMGLASKDILIGLKFLNLVQSEIRTTYNKPLS